MCISLFMQCKIASAPLCQRLYGYAMTIRRAQGCTLDLVGLHFNRRKPDRGYGYVGVSRAKKKIDTFLVGRVRRSDWLPVGGDVRGSDHEQEHPSALSDSDAEYDRSSSSSDHDESSSLGGRSAGSIRGAGERPPYGGHFFWTSRVRRSRRPHRVSLAAKNEAALTEGIACRSMTLSINLCLANHCNASPAFA